jgi:hypothetical protein
MKKTILIAAMAAFSIGAFAQETPQDAQGKKVKNTATAEPAGKTKGEAVSKDAKLNPKAEEGKMKGEAKTGEPNSNSTHGQEVKTAATATPGGPEKGQIMRDAASSKNQGAEKPAQAKKPEHASKPAHAGKPAGAGRPAGAGKSAGAGRPN